MPLMRALVWKDLRLNRLPLLIGAALLVAPYIIVGTALTHMPVWEEAARASAWAVLLATGCHFSVMCSQASLALLSGHVIAAERGDRSAVKQPRCKAALLRMPRMACLDSAVVRRCRVRDSGRATKLRRRIET